MNNKAYKSAMSKIKASEEFKSKVKGSILESRSNKGFFNIRRAIPAIAIVSLVVISIIIYPSFIDNNTITNQKSDDFEIIGDMSSGVEACYVSMLVLDGYYYSSLEWLNYSRYGYLSKANYEDIKGDKIGEVTLDLKGIRYTGTPPDFSSTYGLGTEIYSIKGVKSERAVLVVINGEGNILYRHFKMRTDENQPINLNLNQVFSMVSDSPVASAVELRSEENGAWIRTSENKNLVNLINQEMPKLSILNDNEIGRNPYSLGNYRVPVNLIFEDGPGLHMQVFPEAKIAAVFGGFVKLSSELSRAFEELYNQGEEYPSITRLVPYNQDEIGYLYIVNFTKGDEVLCKEPQWSAGALYSIFDYYRVKEAHIDNEATLVMTMILGRSEFDSILIGLYETKDKEIVISIGETYYKPAKGKMIFEEFHDFLYNHTGIGY